MPNETDNFINGFLIERYALGNEDWKGICKRVSKYLANNIDEEVEFYRMMVSKRGIPNSPILMNSGVPNGYLSACSLLPIEDNLVSIMDGIKNAALIQKQGGGTGFNFSKLRPEGSSVKGTGGVASGPVSFLEGYHACSVMVRQGGKRRGANMGLLSMEHEDIWKWITIKRQSREILECPKCQTKFEGEFKGKLASFNLSVQADKTLFNPENENLLNDIAYGIWLGGEPALMFWDRVEEDNPTPWLGPLLGVNPCGEVPLLAWESCILGSVNLYAHINPKNNKIDTSQVYDTAMTMTKLLNRALDKNCYPLPQMKEAALKTRKIGVGLMGFADALVRIGYKYGDKNSLDTATGVIYTIKRAAEDMSYLLAIEEGAYPAYDEKSNTQWRRNATLLSIAPTGSISIIADVSSGIEPILYPVMQYNREHGTVRIKNRVIRDLELDLDNLPLPFVISHQVSPKDHIIMQAAFQRFVDQSISKTINLPSETTVDDIKKLLAFAWNSGCKGISMYRDQSERPAFIEECVDCAAGVCEV